MDLVNGLIGWLIGYHRSLLSSKLANLFFYGTNALWHFWGIVLWHMANTNNWGKMVYAPNRWWALQTETWGTDFNNFCAVCESVHSLSRFTRFKKQNEYFCIQNKSTQASKEPERVKAKLVSRGLTGVHLESTNNLQKWAGNYPG